MNVVEGNGARDKYRMGRKGLFVRSMYAVMIPIEPKPRMWTIIRKHWYSKEYKRRGENLSFTSADLAHFGREIDNPPFFLIP